MNVGYAWLLENYDIKALPLKQYAKIKPVTRIETIGDCIAIPESVAPMPNVIAQTLFAIRYEGINLSIISQIVFKISEPELRDVFFKNPNSQYLRKLCYLWEWFTNQEIQIENKNVKANYIPLFDPNIYLTSANGIRNKRWRILWNGIGSLQYCVTVRKTPYVIDQLNKKLLEQVEKFTDSLPLSLLNRTLAWAYMDETRNSYAIEKELPSSDKTSRFITLLKQAHNPKLLDEDYLVMLQNATIDNPYLQAASFRTEQNYLSNGLRGALGISYIPPESNLAHELMQNIMHLANNPTQDIDPLVIAAIISFAFVYVHPFMDGNGRLSRFLFHKLLCQQGKLKNGLILPISSTLKKNEQAYKETLESWSYDVKGFWDIFWIDDERYEFKFKGNESIYRYWDATHCVEFMLQSVEQSLEQELKQEAEYLKNYDLIYKKIDSQFDVNNVDLSNLIMFCMEQQGKISNRRRKHYKYKVSEKIFDAIENTWQELME